MLTATMVILIGGAIAAAVRLERTLGPHPTRVPMPRRAAAPERKDERASGGDAPPEALTILRRTQ